MAEFRITRRLLTRIFRAKAAGYVTAALGVSLISLALSPYREFLRTTAALCLMLVIVFVALGWGSAPALFAAFIAVIALRYYFAPPLDMLQIRELRCWPMITAAAVIIATFAATALIVGQLSSRLRRRAEEAERAKAEAEGLYNKLESVFDEASQAEALRRSQSYISLAQNIARAGFFDWNISSGLTSWSDSFYDVLGIDRSVEPNYDNWLGTLHPEDRERMSQTVQDFLASHRDQQEVDYRTIASDGNVRWINARWALFRDPSGVPLRMVGALIDVTGRKLDEEAARTGEQFKSVLLDCVTHDLRTPLTSIRIAATTLLRDQHLGAAMGGNQRELLGVIDEETQHLSDLVGKLIAMARIEAGELRVQQSAAQVNDILAEALHRIRPACARSGVQVDIPEGLPPVNADSGAVAEVIYLLLDNACKYASDTAILVSARRAADGEIQVSIEDRGPGIPPELRERVFEKFYRVEQAFLRAEGQATRTVGSGMGLAIARGIVQAHGGKIWIEDAESRPGTKVVFSLPIGQYQN